MYRQIGLALINIRVFISVIFTIAILALSSMIVTATASNTILDSKAFPTLNAYQPAPQTGANAVTNAGATLASGAQLATLWVGRAFYDSCQAVTERSLQATVATAHGAGIVARSVGHGVGFVGHSISNGVLHVLRIPGKAVASVSPPQAVNSFIRPTESIDAPIISAKTSAEQLAEIDARQKAQLAQLLEAQATANRELGGEVVTGDALHGGYPAVWENARQDSMIDRWGMYNRECVSYAAWKVHETFGTMPYWGGVGNANQWVGNARRAGIATGTTPKVHSVAISMSGYYGHAMWVEKVNGNMIYVSQYNFDLRGRYSEMWIDGSRLTYIYFK